MCFWHGCMRGKGSSGGRARDVWFEEALLRASLATLVETTVRSSSSFYMAMLTRNNSKMAFLEVSRESGQQDGVWRFAMRRWRFHH
jgi:hypothetical protein